MLIDGNDGRGIDVGLYSKFPITNIKSHIFDEVDGKTVFSRDCPEYEVTLPSGEKIHVLINHLKSKGFGETAANDRRRKSQAQQVAKILENYDLRREMVVIMGDLNDSPGSDPLRPLLSVNQLYDVLELEFGNDMDKRWTYYYNSHEQIDYVLVSKPLKEKFAKAGVLRRGMPDIERRTLANEKKYPKVTHKSNAASDHGAVWAEFEL